MHLSSSGKEICVVEIIHAAKGKTDELRKALQAIVPISQKEPGCLQYELLEPMVGGGKFLVLMRWKELKDLKHHEASLHIQEFIKKYDKVVYGEVTQTEWTTIC